MSPRAFDAQIVQRRIAEIAALLEDLRGVGQVSPDRLVSDRLTRHAVERILTQLVELAVSINGHIAATLGGRPPADYRSSFSLAAAEGAIDTAFAERLSRSVGMRNLLVHEYADIDLRLVADAVPRALSDYEEYVAALAAWLSGRAST